MVRRWIDIDRGGIYHVGADHYFFGVGAWILSAAAYFKWTMFIPQSMSDLAGIIMPPTSVISKPSGSTSS